jgi:predicted dienelactone hydrolase
MFLFLVFFPQNAPGMGSKNAEYMVGYSTLGVSGSKGKPAGEISVWYPSGKQHRAQYKTRTDSGFMLAELNAPAAKGLFPVILLSHDMAGNGLAHHDLCSALARAGFVVAAPTHSADNSKDANALFSAALYYHRPCQLAAVLDSLARNAKFGKIADFNRIGTLGSGMGAVTALQLAGVGIAPDSFSAYCAAAPSDKIFCNKWAYSRLLRLPADLRAIQAKYGKDAFAPRQENVRAIGLLAPGGLFMLNKNELAGLKLPLAAVFAEQDELYKAAPFPEPLAQTAQTRLLKDMDHYSVTAPCTEEFLSILPESCGSAPQELRDKAAGERDSFFITFFRSELGLPLEATP